MIAVCLPFGLVLGCSPAPARGLTDTRFDAAIARAAKRNLPTGPHWLRYKAQLWQESRLDPDAVSPVGARGLAQFMPGTWADTIRDLDLATAASPHDARLAIAAGAYYRGRLERGWNGPVRTGRRSLTDRHRLAEASYNAGIGNILKSQRRCDNAAAYAVIVACLPEITGHRHRETWTYVERVERWTAKLRRARTWRCHCRRLLASPSARCSNGASSLSAHSPRSAAASGAWRNMAHNAPNWRNCAHSTPTICASPICKRATCAARS